MVTLSDGDLQVMVPPVPQYFTTLLANQLDDGQLWQRCNLHFAGICASQGTRCVCEPLHVKAPSACGM